MSEFSSLYLRMSVTPDNLWKMQTSQVASPGEYLDWQRWLDAHSNSPQPYKLTAEDLKGFRNTTLAELIASLKAEGHHILAEKYDDFEQVWELGILLFSENYLEMIPYLAALRECASFKTPESGDFLLVFPYLWGGEPDACLALRPGNSRFIDTPTAEQLAQAETFLAGLMSDLGTASS